MNDLSWKLWLFSCCYYLKCSQTDLWPWKSYIALRYKRCRKQTFFIGFKQKMFSIHLILTENSLRMGKLGWGPKWPTPLKIFNNWTKKLKLVSKLGNYKSLREIFQKIFRDQNFRWSQQFGAKNGKTIIKSLEY